MKFQAKSWMVLVLVVLVTMTFTLPVFADGDEEILDPHPLGGGGGESPAPYGILHYFFNWAGAVLPILSNL